MWHEGSDMEKLQFTGSWLSTKRTWDILIIWCLCWPQVLLSSNTYSCWPVIHDFKFGFMVQIKSLNIAPNYYEGVTCAWHQASFCSQVSCSFGLKPFSVCLFDWGSLLRHQSVKHHTESLLELTSICWNVFSHLFCIPALLLFPLLERCKWRASGLRGRWGVRPSSSGWRASVSRNNRAVQGWLHTSSAGVLSVAHWSVRPAGGLLLWQIWHLCTVEHHLAKGP